MKIIKRRNGKHQITLTANEYKALEQIVTHGFSDARRSAESRQGFAPFEFGLKVTDDRSNAPSRPAPAMFKRTPRLTAATDE